MGQDGYDLSALKKFKPCWSDLSLLSGVWLNDIEFHYISSVSEFRKEVICLWWKQKAKSSFEHYRENKKKKRGWPGENYIFMEYITLHWCVSKCNPLISKWTISFGYSELTLHMDYNIICFFLCYWYMLLIF